MKSPLYELQSKVLQGISPEVSESIQTWSGSYDLLDEYEVIMTRNRVLAWSPVFSERMLEPGLVGSIVGRVPGMRARIVGFEELSKLIKR